MAPVRKVTLTPEEIVDGVKRLGSVAAVAREYGLKPNTLNGYVQNQGLREKVLRAAASPKRERVTQATDPVSELDVVKHENRELKAALRRDRKDDVKEQRVLAKLEKLLPVKEPIYTPAPFKKSGKRGHTLVLLWSDTHASEVVSAEETNDANEYDWKIMLERHDQLRRGVLSWADKFAPVEELVILGLGDMLSGSIHEELSETNEMPLIESAVQFGLDGGEFVESFVEHFPKIRFTGVVGNHPRLTHKMRAKGRHDNADWLVYHTIAQRLKKYASVDAYVPKAQTHPIEVYGRRILLQHGDGVMSNMVGVPWGGIIRHEARLRNQYAAQGLPYHHLAIGHYHEPNVVANRRVWVNGSVKGLDEYSLAKFGGGHPACQLLIPFHPKWGMTGAQYIDLDPVRNPYIKEDV